MYKCVDERWDDGASSIGYESIEEFLDMCRQVHGDTPQLYPLDADGTVREVGGATVLEHVDGACMPFAGWTQLGGYRAHREAPGAYGVYERQGSSFVRCALVHARSGELAIAKHIEGGA